MTVPWTNTTELRPSDGDRIVFDTVTNSIVLDVEDDVLDTRRKAWSASPLKAKRGTLYKYIKSVRSASEGCVTDE